MYRYISCVHDFLVVFITPLCSSVYLCMCTYMRFVHGLSRLLHSLLICVYTCIGVCTVCLFRPSPSFSSLLIYVPVCVCVRMCTYVCFVKGAYLLSSRPHTSLSSCFFSLLPRGQTSLPHKPLRVRYLRTIFNSNCIFVQV